MKQITVRLSEDLVDRLDAAAEERVMGRNRLIQFLLAEGLENLIPVEELVRRRSEP